MKYKVIIRPEAENDIKGAFFWYEGKRLGLGYDFLLQVDAGIRFIERNPEVYSTDYKGTKRLIIKRFPFKIIYLVDGATVIVLAVLHGKRSTELIKNRINSLTKRA